MATAAGRRDRWLWIFLWWGLVSLGIMRDGREGGEKGRSGRGTAAVFFFFLFFFPSEEKMSGQVFSNYSRG